EPVEPTEAPVEPTEAPVEPTVAPTSAPTPKPPVTGAISLAGLGIAAIAAGAGIVIFRKKNED
ncbi:MAG: LPXTG cell wall anchor domain-containing protein, partial [Clostridia bacterium]|nr:LPXTG cell wall anchor domain-containing protein [Clostridia bacterium]